LFARACPAGPAATSTKRRRSAACARDAPRTEDRSRRRRPRRRGAGPCPHRPPRAARPNGSAVRGPGHDLRFRRHGRKERDALPLRQRPACLRQRAHHGPGPSGAAAWKMSTTTGRTAESSRGAPRRGCSSRDYRPPDRERSMQQFGRTSARANVGDARRTLTAAVHAPRGAGRGHSGRVSACTSRRLSRWRSARLSQRGRRAGRAGRPGRRGVWQRGVWQRGGRGRARGFSVRAHRPDRAAARPEVDRARIRSPGAVPLRPARVGPGSAALWRGAGAG